MRAEDRLERGRMNDIGKDLQDAFDDGYRRAMKADKKIRILAQLLEVKTELQEQALSRTGASRRTCLAQINGIDKALEIVKKEIGEE